MPSRLFVAGGKEIVSQEGTTQGDNLAMSFYALGTVPLQNDLRVVQPNVKQVWLADDATGAGKLAHLKQWWNAIISHGSKLGYFVNESKSWLILKDESKLEEAKQLFAGTSIKFTTSGKRHLGSAIGSEDFRTEYVTKKVASWCEEVEKLTEFAKSQPHAAFASYIHGEQHRFTYFMRTIPGMEAYLKPLDDVITYKLLPAILGAGVSETERQLYSLPIRDGGLSMSVLTELSQRQFNPT